MQNNLFTQGLDIHNHDQVLDLVSQDWRVLEHAGRGPKNDDNIVWLAVLQDWRALEFAGDGPRNNTEIVLAALEQDIRAAQYIGNGPRYDQRVIDLLGPVQVNDNVQGPVITPPRDDESGNTGAAEDHQGPARPVVATPSSDVRPVAAPTQVAEKGIVDIHGRLQVQGSKITSSKTGAPVSLYGISHFWINEGWVGERFCTEASVNAMCDLGVDVLRVPVGVQEGGGYLHNRDSVRARMNSVVSAAINKGKYVIIDWHSRKATDNEPEAIAFFKEMAVLYGKCPNVIFEIYNEPVGGETWPKIKGYSERVLAAIRQQGADNLVIAGTPTWSQDVDVASQSPLNDTNVAYALHFYAGTHHDHIRKKARTAIASGLPLFISECGGVSCTGDGAFDHVQWQAWVDLIEEHGLSTIGWHMGNTGKFETSSAIFQHVNPEGPWNDEHFTESGRAFRALLQSPRRQPELADTSSDHSVSTTHTLGG